MKVFTLCMKQKCKNTKKFGLFEKQANNKL